MSRNLVPYLRRAVWLLLPMCVCVGGGSARAQGAARFAGEELTFDVHSSRFKGSGTGSMRASAAELRGRNALLLSFDFRAKVLLFKVRSDARSWVDPATFSTLRFTKTESSPLGPVRDSVDVYPEERRWSADTTRGETATATPLDELSFIYFLRTLPFEDRTSFTLSHHFDTARNPVQVSLLGRGVVPGPAGPTEVLVVSMKVKDPGRVKSSGLIQLYLTDDAERLPVRIEFDAPLAGKLVLTLRERHRADTLTANPDFPDRSRQAAAVASGH